MNEELKIIISAEISKLKESVKQAKGEIEGLASKAGISGEKIQKTFQNMSSKTTAVLKTAGTAIAGTVTALGGLSVATAEYRESQAKLIAAFETAGASAEVAKETYNDLYRVLGDGDQATEAANHLAKLTTNEKDLAEWTNICQGVYATFGDSIPIEGLTEAANETAKTGSLTGSLADALNWAGIAEEDFQAKLDACNTEAEREKLIRETLNSTYADAAAAYEKTAADTLAQNEAQAKLSESMAQLGAVMAPVVTAFTDFAANALAVVVPYVQQLGEQYGPALKDALQGIGEFLKPIADFIANNLPVIATIGGIILGICATITTINAAMTAYNAVKAAYTTVTTIATAAQTAFAAANIAALAPILAVVAAIAAVIAIIVVCVKHWDEIKEAIGKAWDWIKEKTKAAVEAVVGFFTNLFTKAKEIVTNLTSAVKNKFEEIKNGMSEKIQAAKTAVSEKFTQMKESMGTIMQAAKDTVNEKLVNMKNAYNEHGGGIKGIAAAAMEGVKGYYSAGYTFIDNLTGGKLSSIANTMKTKMNEAKTAVSNILNNIKEKFSSIMENAKSIVSGAIEKIKGFFNFKWELPKIKLPHFSISGKFSLNPPQIPHFSVDWYKLGGVFDKPTLFAYGNRLGGLGEDGAEAIVPLEKNTKWIEKLAESLTAKQGRQPIILQVDGKTFARASVDSINSLTKQTGKFPFQLT